jgi:uncharacterized protein (DUF1330 family)
VPAYVIAAVEIHDHDLYRKYKPLVEPSLAKFGGRFLARGTQYETLEGEWSPEWIVVLEFPSQEEARAWHASREYADAKFLRQQASDGTLLLLEGSA